MLYDKYQDKIMGVIRTIGKIRRFRVLIIAVLVTVLALTTGFLVTKGIVLEDPYPEALSYGEELPQTAKARFSSVRYEYRLEGSSEWTEQMPSKVGRYAVRAVSKGSFGRVTYGKEHIFVITPQAVTVSAAESAVQYGTLPTLSAQGLRYEDTAACEQFSFADTAKRSTEVTPVASSVVILNRLGEDVTDCYTVTAVTSAITLNPRPITLTVASKEIEYNGQPLTADVYELTAGELAVGDRISTEFGCSRTEVGETVNEMTVCITNQQGANVTGQYQIEQIKGLLKVVPRIVVLSTGSGEYVYDGAEHQNTTFVIDPSTPLLSGHEMTLTNAPTVKNVGEIANRLGLDICDATGESVKDLYYEVRVSVGTLKITPRPLSVQTETQKWVYDGDVHTADGFTVTDGSLVEGHTAILDHAPTIESAGEIENQGSLRVMEGNTDVTSNYAVDMTFGLLTVEKRPVQLTSPDVSFVYNSTAQSCPDAPAVTDGSLVEGHILAADYVSLTDAGAVPNTFTVSVRNAMWEDLSANYSIQTVFGTLTVEKRPVTLRTDSAQRVYDGMVLYRDSVTVISEYGIAEGEHYVVDTHTELCNVGRVVNELSVLIFEDDVDRTSNYVITYDTEAPGYLEIFPRPITLYTASATRVYNGLPLTCHEYTLGTEEEGSLGLAPGQYLADVVFTGSILDVVEGGVENTFTFTILNEAGEETLSNYDVTVICGRLTLSPRPVTFVSQSTEKVYDDTPLVHHEYTVCEAGEDVGVVSFHTVTVTFTASITDVGEIENSFAVVIKDENGRDVTQNYEITYEYGILKVTPRPITVVTGSDSKVYDDTPLYCEDVTWESVTSLLEHHSIVVIERTEQTNVAEHVENRLVVSILKGDDDKTGNYEITYRYGTLTVTKRHITLVTGSDSKTYDDTPLYCEQVSCEPGDALVSGHAYVIAERTEQTDVATDVTNKLVVRIVKGDDDKSENYEISYRYGTLTVTKRPITVVTGSDSRVYDDTPFYCEDVTYKPADALVSGHGYVVVDRTEQTDVGSVENKLVVRIVKGEADKTENYDITYEYGTLTVTKRPITVVTGTDHHVYDDTPFYCEDVSCDPADALVNGHRYQVIEHTEITDVGSVENKLVIRIVKGDDDKSENYEISYRYGTLTVTPRPITVVTGSIEQVYNGKPLSLDTVSVSTPGGLVSEHALRVMSPWPSITDAGSIDNAVTVRIFKGDVDKTANYKITYEYGTLTVRPRPVTVVTGSAEQMYDDTPLQKEEISVLAPTGEDDGLLAQHILTVLTPFPTAIDVGTVQNAVFVAVMEGERNVSENYEIRYLYGNLVITPRPITVVTGSAQREYDDTPLYHDAPEITGEYGLVAGHEYRVITHTEQTDVASGVENVLTLRIYKGTSDKTENYAITYENGTLTVTPRHIKVITGSAERMYNGLPLFNTDCTAADLVSGHILSAVTRTELTDVGSVENALAVHVLKGDADKTANYVITYENGTLTVTPRAITVTAASAEKPYDGLPLLAPKAIAVPSEDLDALNSEVGPDHRFTWSILSAEGSQTEVGESPSSIAPENVLFFFDGQPVAAGNIAVTVLEGTLTVTAAEDSGSEEGGGGGPLDGDGSIGGGDIGDDEGEGDTDDNPSARVFTSKSVTVYLRAWSYGDYNGRSWETAPTVYGPLLNNTHSMNYLTGEALAAVGFTRLEMRIESYYGDYLLPYYLTLDEHDYDIQTDDVRHSGDTSKEYALYYYAYDYLNNPTLIGAVPATYAEAEAAYKAFVYEQYLQIPEKTLHFLQGIIAEQGFDAKDPDIIAKVAAYIRAAAVYDLKYDRTLDDAEDIVIAFLSQYKTGICQHYASAATLLYRALGIPARYTAGYVINTVAGEWVDVTGDTAHAWVEVYLDGVGWVQVEVTGSGEQQPDGGEEEEEDTTKKALEIYLFEIQKYYDGTPLSYDPDDWYCMTALPTGYTVRLELSGSLTNVGSLDLKELQQAHADKLIVLDAEGNDVSEQYRLVLKGKPLTVKPRLLEITAGSAVKTFDGEELTCSTYVITQGALASGHSINERALRFDGGQTEVGESYNSIKAGSIKILDADGNDVTANYSITLVVGTLTVLESEE